MVSFTHYSIPSKQIKKTDFLKLGRNLRIKMQNRKKVDDEEIIAYIESDNTEKGLFPEPREKTKTKSFNVSKPSSNQNSATSSQEPKYLLAIDNSINESEDFEMKGK